MCANWCSRPAMDGRPLHILELSTEERVQRWFIDPLAKYLREKGHTVWQVDGSHCSIRRGHSVWDVVAIFRIWWRLWRWQIDVLHVQTAKAGGVGRIAAWLARTPRVIYTAHDFPFHVDLPRWRYRLYVWIEWLLAKTCHAITVDSPAVKNRGLQIAPAYKLHVIPVGVDTEKFSPRPKAFSSTIGTVARLVPEKRIDTLLRIVRWLPPPIRCVIVGAGPIYQDLVDLSDELGLGMRVEFVGEQEDVRPSLASMDVFVLPTRREGLSVAVMEAMSMALPVVVSDLPAFSDLVLHEQTGYRAKSHEFVMWIRHLLRSETERRRVGLAARAHVLKYYEQRVSHQAYERVLIQ